MEGALLHLSLVGGAYPSFCLARKKKSLKHFYSHNPPKQSKFKQNADRKEENEQIYLRYNGKKAIFVSGHIL